MTGADIRRLRALQPRGQDILLTLRRAVGQFPKIRSDLIGLAVRAAWLRVKIEVFMAQTRLAETAEAPNEGVAFHHPLKRGLPVQMDERFVLPLSGEGGGIARNHATRRGTSPSEKARHGGALPGGAFRKSSISPQSPDRGAGFRQIGGKHLDKVDPPNGGTSKSVAYEGASKRKSSFLTHPPHRGEGS